MAAKKHDHGRLYRAKIVPFRGSPEYGDWFSTESELRSVMQRITRPIGNRYYCESKMIACSECDVDESPRVIATL